MLCVYVISADHDLKYMYVFIYIFFPVHLRLYLHFSWRLSIATMLA